MIEFFPITKHLRHAELVSASIGPRQPEPCAARWTLKQVQGDGCGRGQGDPISGRASPQRRKAKTGRKINPMRVLALDKVDLPLAMPALQLLLAQDRAFHVSEHFKPNEAVNGVAAGKSWRGSVAMLVQTGEQRRCHANVQRAVGLACQNINARLLVDHTADCGSRWMLKQVQHDEQGVSGD